MAFKVSGKARRKLRELIKQLEYQQGKFGSTEIGKLRILDLKKNYNQKL